MNPLAPAAPVAPEARAAVARTLRERLGRPDLPVEVEPGTDHDGDPVVYVIVRHGAGDAGPDAEASLSAGLAAQDALSGLGEHRPTRVRHRFAEHAAPGAAG